MEDGLGVLVVGIIMLIVVVWLIVHLWPLLVLAIVGFLGFKFIFIVPDTSVLVTEQMGVRRFLSPGLNFIYPFGLEKKVCSIPIQPTLFKALSGKLNIPDGIIENLFVSLEYQVSDPQLLYDQVKTDLKSETLQIDGYLSTWFSASARDVVKKLPIESICEDEEDGTLASELRIKIEKDFQSKGLSLVGSQPIRVTGVTLDQMAEEARRIRYVELKKAAAKTIYARGEAEAIKTLQQEMDISLEQAQRLYLQIKTLAMLEGMNLRGLMVSDMLSAKLLEIGKRG